MAILDLIIAIKLTADPPQNPPSGQQPIVGATEAGSKGQLRDLDFKERSFISAPHD
jgi:hypothetical protein